MHIDGCFSVFLLFYKKHNNGYHETSYLQFKTHYFQDLPDVCFYFTGFGAGM